MIIFVVIGVLLTLAGLCGLIVSILRANRLRKRKLSDEEARDELRKLIPLNLGSLCVSAMGLMLVIVALVMR